MQVGDSVALSEVEYGDARISAHRAHIYGSNSGKKFRTALKSVDGVQYALVQRLDDEEPQRRQGVKGIRKLYGYEDLEVGGSRRYLPETHGQQFGAILGGLPRRGAQLGRVFTARTQASSNRTGYDWIEITRIS
jgi:hypothetical protein